MCVSVCVCVRVCVYVRVAMHHLIINLGHNFRGNPPPPLTTNQHEFTNLRHFHSSLYFGLVHKERVENGHVIGQHVDVQFVFVLEVVHKVLEGHLRSIVL